MIRQLDDNMMVSGQIQPADVVELKQLGVRMIVNNRPDGEEPLQPTGADIEAAAREAGIDYRHVPIDRGIGPGDVEDMKAALEAAQGRVLAFCGSGRRSALTWAVVRRHQGASLAEIEDAAANAGVDLTPVTHLL